ncbi:MAG: hypothetical protein AAFQ82_12665, partial [Myxococcota bacterium]
QTDRIRERVVSVLEREHVPKELREYVRLLKRIRLGWARERVLQLRPVHPRIIHYVEQLRPLTAN